MIFRTDTRAGAVDEISGLISAGLEVPCFGVMLRVWMKRPSPASPFTHETLLQCGILCPRAVPPSKALLCIDSGEQGDPGEGRVLPVCQTLLEGATKLRAGLRILQGKESERLWRNFQQQNYIQDSVCVIEVV